MLQRTGRFLKKVLFGVGDKGLIAMAVVMMGLVMLTVVDVTMRRAFDAPLGFTYEIMGLGMTVIVWGSILYSTGLERHISVDVIMSRIPGRFKRIMVLIWDFVTIVVLFLLGWQSILYAIKLANTKTETQMLDIPVYPFVIIVAFGAIWAGLMLYCNFINSCREKAE